jgi:hypothetical protein
MSLAGTGALYLGGSTGGSDRCIRWEILGAYGTYTLDTANTASGNSAWTMNDYHSYSHASIPLAPVKIGISMQSFFGITVTWWCLCDDETGFDIQWSEDGGAYGQQQSVGANVLIVYKAVCSNGVEYVARVRSKNAAGESVWNYSGSAFGDNDCQI